MGNSLTLSVIILKRHFALRACVRACVCVCVCERERERERETRERSVIYPQVVSKSLNKILLIYNLLVLSTWLRCIMLKENFCHCHYKWQNYRGL